ncbi:hypothetical protein A4H97_16055 [Niastella yeongjuensis]|uniref:Uncharacterized protein n=1 Tax=Niastella yeongjuensis TaxID=354355 RepID=A0A1V9E0Y4_9BACT|nr:hypothetical protein A4H97_16055 [Niastella yeongjuensis]
MYKAPGNEQYACIIVPGYRFRPFATTWYRNGYQIVVEWLGNCLSIAWILPENGLVLLTILGNTQATLRQYRGHNATISIPLCGHYDTLFIVNL